MLGLNCLNFALCHISDFSKSILDRKPDVKPLHLGPTEMGMRSVRLPSILLQKIFMLATFCIVLLFPSSETTAQDSAAANFHQSFGPFEVTYDTVQTPEGPSGRITVRVTQDGSLILEDNQTTAPCGCPGFPAVSLLPLKKTAFLHLGKDKEAATDLLLLAGTDAGHHTTFRVIRNWLNGPTVAVLDINQSEPNITWDAISASYVVKVERQELFSGDSAHQNYLMLYRLHIDEATMAFVPMFGGSSADVYWNRYRELTHLANSDAQKRIGQMIAALVSTGDAERICREISTLQARFSERTIKTWLRQVQDAGYPAIGIKSCGGK